MTRPIRLDTNILAILSDAQVDGNVVRLTRQIDRKEYVAVNDVLAALGGKWDRKAKGHVFGEDPAARLDLAILTGQVERPKDFGFFPTPPDVAARVAELADPRDYELVLEPSAGDGALIDAVLERAPFAGVFAVELLEGNYKGLVARYASNPRMRMWRGDFLSIAPEPRYHRVVANPPFAGRADIDHVVRAWDWLAPGGRLVAIMSAGVRFRQDGKTMAFRAFVDQYGGEIDDLPEGAFKPSGTMVRTVVVRVDKP